MSHPPVPPSNPNDPESGSHPENPEYGQQNPPAPRYGEQRPDVPQYGQNAPQYGQNPPQYGQNAPQYGQNAPQYGQNPPQYGQNAPQYGQNAPQYGQNAPQYGQAQPSPYGQAPYGQSPYGQSPLGQEQGQQPGGIPKPVNTSFWLIIAAGVLWILALLLSIPALESPEIRRQFDEQLEAAGATGSGVTFEDIQGVVVGTIVVVGLIGAGLYALVALNVRKGKNWARILGTVLAALSIFSILPLGINTLAVVAGVAAMVLLYTPQAAPYFQKQPWANPYSPGNPYGR